MWKINKPILAIAFLFGYLSLILIPQLSLDIQPYTPDSAKYYLRALSLTEGTGFSTLEFQFPTDLFKLVTPPMLPLLLAVPMKLIGTTHAVAKLTLFLLTALSVLSVYIFYSRLTETHVSASLLTIWLFLTAPALQMTPFLNTDIPFLGMLALVMLFFIYMDSENQQGEKRPLWVWFLGGCAIAGLITLRYVGIAFIVAGVFWVLYSTWQSKDTKRWKRLISFSGGIATIFGIFFLWVIFESDNFFQSYFNLALSVDQQHSSNHSIQIIFNLFNSLLGYGEKFIDYNASVGGGIPAGLVALAYLSLVATGFWARRQIKASWILILFLAVYLGTICSFSLVRARYLLPVILLSLPLVVYGLQHIAEYLAKSRQLSMRSKAMVVMLPLVFMVFWRTIPAIPNMLKAYRNGPEAIVNPLQLDLRDACMWIGEHYPEDTVVISNKASLVRIYSGCKVVFADTAEIERIVGQPKVLLFYDTFYIETEIFYEAFLPEVEGFTKKVYDQNGTKVYEMEFQAWVDSKN